MAAFSNSGFKKCESVLNSFSIENSFRVISQNFGIITWNFREVILYRPSDIKFTQSVFCKQVTNVLRVSKEVPKGPCRGYWSTERSMQGSVRYRKVRAGVIEVPKGPCRGYWGTERSVQESLRYRKVLWAGPFRCWNCEPFPLLLIKLLLVNR